MKASRFFVTTFVGISLITAIFGLTKSIAESGGLVLEYSVPEIEGEATFHTLNTIMTAEGAKTLPFYFTVIKGNYYGNRTEPKEVDYKLSSKNYESIEGTLRLDRDVKDDEMYRGELKVIKERKMGLFNQIFAFEIYY